MPVWDPLGKGSGRSASVAVAGGGRHWDKGATLRFPRLHTEESEDAAQGVTGGASVGLSEGAGAAVGHGREGLSMLCP